MLFLKFVSLLLVLAAGLVGGFLPLRMGRGASGRDRFAVGNACAGGIFLGVGLIHMLPDAGQGFAALAPHQTYPLASLICAIGFGLFLMLEKVLLQRTCVREEDAGSPGNPLLAYGLAVVLSVHSMIAGVALGAERTHTQVLILLAAILAHKGSAAFALGVMLHRRGVAHGRFLGVIAAFSCMTPLGILVGTVLSQVLRGREAMVFTSVFDALAAATFLYVATVDILAPEFAERGRSWAKFAGFGFGLGVAALVALWT